MTFTDVPPRSSMETTMCDTGMSSGASGSPKPSSNSSRAGLWTPAMDTLLEMGMDEGMRAALGQTDDLLARATQG